LRDILDSKLDIVVEVHCKIQAPMTRAVTVAEEAVQRQADDRRLVWLRPPTFHHRILRSINIFGSIATRVVDHLGAPSANLW
jgi:hypothetical protein